MGVRKDTLREVTKVPQSIYGCFLWKAGHVRELEEESIKQPIRVEVVKAILLPQRQFRRFAANLLRDMPFLAENKHLTGYDGGVTRCLLVTAPNERGGILVDCQGYNYARYSAYLADKTDLDLRGVPVEDRSLEPRQRREGAER